jgi:hypothetical protein
MANAPTRIAVDLSAYPDLVVIYLGMRVEEPRGFETLQTLGPQIQAAVEQQPDGLLLHEPITFSEDPLHVGMRQYWRDFEALEAWSRLLPHKEWWTDYLRDRGGTSFWHETYFRRGGFETMYVDVDDPIGLARFAPSAPAHGPMFSARQRRDADRSNAAAT